MTEQRTERRLDALLALARSDEAVPELPSGPDALFERIAAELAPVAQADPPRDALAALLDQARDASPSIADPDALFARITAELAPSGTERPVEPTLSTETQALHIQAPAPPVDVDARLSAMLTLSSSAATAAEVADPDALFGRILPRVMDQAAAATQVEQRLAGLVTLAKTSAAEVADPEALFTTIERTIAEDQVEQRLQEMTQTARRSGDDVWSEPGLNPSLVATNDPQPELVLWRHPAAMMAAAVLLAFCAWWLVRPTAPAPFEPPVLQAETTTVAAVQVFASDDAAWTLEGTEALVLTLERGDALIEFVPEHDETLRVVTPHTTIDVVGTAFYVTTGAAGETVTVVTGTVDVDREGTEVRLETNDHLNRDAEVEPAPAELREALTALVDPDEHQRRLRSARTAAAVDPTDETLVAAADVEATPAPTPTEPPPAEAAPIAPSAPVVPAEPVEPSVEAAVQPPPEAVEEVAPAAEAAPTLSRRDLREAARAAAEDGRWDEVAAHDEALLDLLSRRSAEAATLRLELARLYLNELGSPRRAERHMERFLRYHPDDVAFDAVRSSYCALIAEHGRESAHCAGD